MSEPQPNVAKWLENNDSPVADYIRVLQAALKEAREELNGLHELRRVNEDQICALADRVASFTEGARQIVGEMKVWIASGRKSPGHVVARWAEAILALGTKP